MRHGTLSFEVMWNGDQHPHSLSILDPDGTAAQITGIAIIQSNPDGKGNSNANGTGSTNGNGNKPASTPTPNGNKPSGTPTPHH